MSIVLDKKVLIGIGIGMIITVALMSSYKYIKSKSISDSEIEERARNLGMHYESECKVFFKGDEVDD